MARGVGDRRAYKRYGHEQLADQTAPIGVKKNARKRLEPSRALLTPPSRAARKFEMLDPSYQKVAQPSRAPAPVETSLVGRLALFFRTQPGQWVDGKALSTIAGGYAWRTRVSDLRRAPFFMYVENRQRRLEVAPGKRITISEYCYRPAALPEHHREPGA